MRWLTVSLTLATLLTSAQGAVAQSRFWSWCLYDIGRTNHVTCAFDSWGQCMATLSGIGGLCVQNLQYPVTPPAPSHRRRGARG
jgi:hypothetical protein